MPVVCLPAAGRSRTAHHLRRAAVRCPAGFREAASGHRRRQAGAKAHVDIGLWPHRQHLPMVGGSGLSSDPPKFGVIGSTEIRNDRPTGCLGGRDVRAGRRSRSAGTNRRQLAGSIARDAVVGRLPQAPGGKMLDRGQARSGIARTLARAALKPTAHGQRAGRWSVSRRAERVSRPARLNSLRRSVFVVTMSSPRPIRAVQRARLWAITCTASQAPLAANLPDGRWFRPTPYLSHGSRSRSRRDAGGRPPGRGSRPRDR